MCFAECQGWQDGRQNNDLEYGCGDSQGPSRSFFPSAAGGCDRCVAVLVWLHGGWNVECGGTSMPDVHKSMVDFFNVIMERGREVVDPGVLRSSTVQWGVRLHSFIQQRF